MFPTKVRALPTRRCTLLVLSKFQGEVNLSAVATIKGPVEKRQNKRYRLEAVVAFSWESSDQVSHQGSGLTRDFSISGAFIVTQNQLPVGSSLQMDISLPPLHAAGRGSRLRTLGRVVRSGSDGFAVVADMGPGSRLHRDQRSRISSHESRNAMIPVH